MKSFGHILVNYFMVQIHLEVQISKATSKVRYMLNFLLSVYTVDYITKVRDLTR